MNSTYKWIVVIAGIATALLAFAVESAGQGHEGLLYGKVYTENNNSYSGVIRWGTEEALWTDLFNASKTSDRFKSMVPEKSKENDSWMSIDWSIGSIWEDKVIPHQFNCQFGNLTEITRLNDRRARLKFKDGRELVVSGEGYNDLESKIHVADAELGTLSFDWSKIAKIEFMPTPSKTDAHFGLPLFGTVEGVRKEKFTGYIVWDNDERLTSDKLDGDGDDGDMSIRFGEIASIERRGNGSNVVLRSGREFYLTGSNDVNSENRGVLVVSPGIGVIEISWSAFRKVTFSAAEVPPQPYRDFAEPSFLLGTVSMLDGDDVNGRIIYDVDEVLDFEIVEGVENDIEYHIPFRNIKKITPKNFDYSLIELRNGDEVFLGGGQDVSAKNGGILVFVKGKKDPVYINWKKINEITFN